MLPTYLLDVFNQWFVYGVKHLDGTNTVSLENSACLRERRLGMITQPDAMVPMGGGVLAGCYEPVEERELVEGFLVCEPLVVCDHDTAGWFWDVLSWEQLIGEKDSSCRFRCARPSFCLGIMFVTPSLGVRPLHLFVFGNENRTCGCVSVLAATARPQLRAEEYDRLKEFINRARVVLGYHWYGVIRPGGHFGVRDEFPECFHAKGV